MKDKIVDDSFSIGQGFNRVRENSSGWTSGVVVTPHGMVDAYAQGDDKHFHMTRLDFVWKGRVYVRTYHNKRYSPRAISSKAKKFSEGICQNLETQ